MFTVTARLTLEFRLALAISFLAVTTLAACPTGVARIDEHDLYAIQSSFVLDECSELKVCPASHPGSLPLPKRCPLADTLEVFKSDPAFGVLSGFDESFGNAMVNVLAVTRLLLAHTDDRFVTRSSRLAVSPFGFLADRATTAQQCDPFRLDCLALMNRAVRINRDVLDPEIHADEIGGRNGSAVRNIDSDDEEPLAVLAQNEIRLPFLEGEAIRLVFTHHKWDHHATLQSGDAYAVWTLKPNVLAHAVRDGSMLAESRLFIFVPLVGFTDLRETAARHIRRKSKLLTQVAIGNLVKLERSRQLPLKRNPCQPRCGFIESLDRRLEPNGGFRVGQELRLQSELHFTSVGQYLPYLNTRTEDGDPVA